MYTVDAQDTVMKIKSAPVPDAGAPLPFLWADEHSLYLGYFVSSNDSKWDGTYTTVASPDAIDETKAIIKFIRPYAQMFGPPNDEAFDGHPLASRGLSPYGVYEIKESSWLRRLEQMNAVHPLHNRANFLASRRHFIFAFHDTTFECIASGFEFSLTTDIPNSPFSEIMQTAQKVGIYPAP